MSNHHGGSRCPSFAPKASDVDLFRDPCEAIPRIRAAIFALASGQTVAEVRNGNDWLKMLPIGGASIPALRRLLYEAECACDPRYRHGRSVRLGPSRPVNAMLPGGAGYYGFW